MRILTFSIKFYIPSIKLINPNFMQNIQHQFSRRSPQEEDRILIPALQEQLRNTGVVDIKSLDLERALNVCSDLIRERPERILLLNLNDCSNNADALLCLAQALGSFQADENFLKIELRQRPTIIIAFS